MVVLPQDRTPRPIGTLRPPPLLPPHGIRPGLACRRLPFDPDADYTWAFNDLLELERTLEDAWSLPGLLVKASMMVRAGSYACAREAAEDAIEDDSTCAEAHYLRGVALLAQALTLAGVLVRGPGDPPLPPHEDLRALLGKARASLERCLRRGRDDDEEAAWLHGELARALDGDPVEPTLRRRLARLAA